MCVCVCVCVCFVLNEQFFYLSEDSDSCGEVSLSRNASMPDIAPRQLLVYSALPTPPVVSELITSSLFPETLSALVKLLIRASSRLSRL